MFKTLIFILLAFGFFFSCVQTREMKGDMVVAFYNMENLFDTIDDPNKIDEEFTPGSEKQWNSERYTKKVNDLSKVLSSIQSGNWPILIGACEIENDLVINDLISSSPMKKGHYQIIWHDGPDGRSIDCALMYRPSHFKLVSKQFLKVENQADTSFRTREIVYAFGTIGKESFHIFINHWPSRRSGQDDSKNLRALTASVLRSKIDSIITADPAPNIIIMGDMNDEPGDESLTQVLKAIPNKEKPQPTHLVNLMYDEYERGEGSYNYRGNWDMIDNLIVSGHLIIKEKGIRTTLDNGFIFHKPFMEYVNEQGEMSPNRTYGRTYYGGISDHFPIYFILKK